MIVIRGRVVDRQGQPLRRATIDLQGPFVFVNCFHADDDGYFVMPLVDSIGLRPPPGQGYSLRVRDQYDSVKSPLRWESVSFSLDPATPELAVVIAVPR